MVVGEGYDTKNKYIGQCGKAIGDLSNKYLQVKFDDGDDDYFEVEDGVLKEAAVVLLLRSDAAEALLRHCAGDREVGMFKACTSNTGLFQATHLSLQESECAESFHNAAINQVSMKKREGIMKWLQSADNMALFLNDGWYSNMLGLVRTPSAENQQHTLVPVSYTHLTLPTKA